MSFGLREVSAANIELRLTHAIHFISTFICQNIFGNKHTKTDRQTDKPDTEQRRQQLHNIIVNKAIYEEGAIF